jgi:hypothetical protein
MYMSFIILDNWPSDSPVLTVCGHTDVCDGPMKTAGWGVLETNVSLT